MRVSPSLGSDLLVTIPDGTVVALRIDLTDTVRADGIRWWPVVVNGKDGWIAGPYLSDSNGATANSGDESASSGNGFAIGSYVRAQTNDNANVNVRTKPNLSGDVLTQIRNGGWCR